MPDDIALSIAETSTQDCDDARFQGDQAKFDAWLRDFDARHARVAARLDEVLRSLGVDPVRCVRWDVE
jgi:hypothetical protein